MRSLENNKYVIQRIPNQSLGAKDTFKGRFSPLSCSPSRVGIMTKHASLLNFSISGVKANSKLLMISTVSAWTSQTANRQPMQLRTPPANVKLVQTHASVQTVSKDDIQTYRLPYTPTFGVFLSPVSLNHLSGLYTCASSPNASSFLQVEER